VFDEWTRAKAPLLDELRLQRREEAVDDRVIQQSLARSCCTYPGPKRVGAGTSVVNHVKCAAPR
jgi:hypothetical protein